MARVVIFDEGHVNRRVLQHLPSVNTPDYEGRTDVVINPDISGLVEPVLYWREDAGTIRDMNTAEKSALDAELDALLTTEERDGAKAIIDDRESLAKALRAQADIIKDEINILRTWLRDLKVATAAANNLGQYKANVAALPDTPDRTLVQLRNQMKARIDSGQVDN